MKLTPYPGTATHPEEEEEKEEVVVCLGVLVKGEWERYGIFDFALTTYSFYMYILQLLNFEIIKRKMGVTELNFAPELWF